MSQEKKFIVTQDKQTAETLLASNFQLVSNIGTSYIFLNEVPKNFSFANFDKSKIVYTSTLAI
ncbi:MAG: hypothetical protein UHD64_02935 [Bacteroidales bacterium]|nr:hypothetical protein [Bacteroidales bacterium]